MMIWAQSGCSRLEDRHSECMNDTVQSFNSICQTTCATDKTNCTHCHENCQACHTNWIDAITTNCFNTTWCCDHIANNAAPSPTLTHVHWTQDDLNLTHHLPTFNTHCVKHFDIDVVFDNVAKPHIPAVALAFAIVVLPTSPTSGPRQADDHCFEDADSGRIGAPHKANLNWLVVSLSIGSKKICV